MELFHKTHGSQGAIILLDDKKIAFITCVNSDYWYEECILYLKNIKIPEKMTAEFIPVRDAVSMTSGYNRAMTSSDAKYKIYLHQDTFVVNRNLIADLLKIFNSDAKIGAIGVIGCVNLPETGVWWDGMRTFGRVLHACEPESVVDSECLEPDGDFQQVEAVDGLFFATQYDLPWREDLFDGWHMYDASQCKEFARAGYKIVVPNQSADFWCIHCPKEKPLDPKYRRYQKIFLREYGRELNPEV